MPISSTLNPATGHAPMNQKRSTISPLSRQIPDQNAKAARRQAAMRYDHRLEQGVVCRDPLSGPSRQCSAARRIANPCPAQRHCATSIVMSATVRPAKVKSRKPRAMSLAEVRGFLEALAKVTPDPRSELSFATPYTLLVAVVLSAQATDASVNRATETLFAEAATPRGNGAAWRRGCRQAYPLDRTLAGQGPQRRGAVAPADRVAWRRGSPRSGGARDGCRASAARQRTSC